MTLQQLEYVLAVDEQRHFVKAAESCGVTQSTLSCMIHKLEEELDIVIFDRNAHPIRPTMAGEQIIQQAKIVLYHSNQLRELSLTERQKCSGTFSLGITPTVAPYIIPELFQYIGSLPNLSMNAQEIDCDAIIRKLKNAELDMGIMSTTVQDDQLLRIPLYKEKLMIYISPIDPLREEKTLIWETLPYNRLWSLKHEISFQRQIGEDKNNLQNNAYESGNVPTLLYIVNKNGGFTILPELHTRMIREEDKANIRPVLPTKTREVCLFVRNDFVREKLLNIVATGIKKIVPKEMIDERLKKYEIHL